MAERSHRGRYILHIEMPPALLRAIDQYRKPLGLTRAAYIRMRLLQAVERESTKKLEVAV